MSNNSKEWVMSKYNVYRVTTEHGVSRKMMGETAAQIRKDFEVAMPGVKIKRIELVG
jgi:hypothetical protein